MVKDTGRQSRTLSITSALTLIVLFFLSTRYGYSYGFLIVALLLAAYGYYQFFWVGFRGLRRFARAWKEQRQNPPVTQIPYIER